MVSQVPKKTFLGHNLLEDGGGVEREIINEYSGSQNRKKKAWFTKTKGGNRGVGTDFQKY